MSAKKTATQISERSVATTSAKGNNTYIRVSTEIQQWPTWKKEAYDNTFAVSVHAKKLTVK